MKDVIIIGAGPAGSSCAYNIKRFYPAAHVLLLDQAEFPRYKPCGGGISPEVKNYVDYDLSPGIDSVCNEVALVANKREVSSNQYPLWMVRREKFDTFLLNKAKDSGVEFISGCTVNLISKNVCTTNQGEFSAKIIVIAEGGKGKLAKKFGFYSKHTLLAAMEYEHYTKKLNHKLFVDFDYNENGYAWNFPKSDGLSLGIGGYFKGKNKGNVKLPEKLKNYTTQFDVNTFEKNHLHGHPIRLYSGKRKLVKENVMLIGECAGCVDPLTAEGIRPAIKSGFLAAKVIADHLQHREKLSRYNSDFHHHIGKDFRYARILSHVVNNHLSKIMPLLAKPAALTAFMSVFNGKSTYREHINLRRMARLLMQRYRQ